MKKILLTQGKVAIVDDCHYDWVNRWKWFTSNNNNGIRYAARKLKGKTIYMHRIILNTPQGMLTDHLDGDGLNNLRSNLRIANQSLNQHNQHTTRPNKTSKYKGVGWHKKAKKWRSRITINGKVKYLGLFDNEEKANNKYQIEKQTVFGD